MQNLYKQVMQMNLFTKQKQTHSLKRRNLCQLLKPLQLCFFISTADKETHHNVFVFIETFLDCGYI